MERSELNMELKEETVKLDNLLRRINIHLNKYTKTKLSKYSLTFPRFHTLWVISKLEPVNMSQLNKKLMAANSTLTVTVDHLVEEGFVDRCRDKKDRRIVLLKTTQQGKMQLQKLLNERQLFFQKALNEIDIDEQKQAICLLENLLNNLINL
ncbi:MarR family transcriptional regulator [Iocasia frigidifontis]|uniref:MarR family transcriptional regulator n=2 Tax=Iocasia fonsfrigidae TaxID=2682810 RepID=A0A8A7K6J8_9FIRM|nr:MarR family transcriptional regulator [Iocasia fonsfrigidae]